MNLITLDWETFVSDEFNLRTLKKFDYFNSPMFEIQALGIKLNKEPTKVFFGADIADGLLNYPLSESLLIAHNMSLFDRKVCSLSNVNPKLYGCTMMMGRLLFGKNLSLNNLSRLLGFEGKGSVNALPTYGKRLSEFTDNDKEVMSEYLVNDVEQCHNVFEAMYPEFADLLTDMDAKIRSYKM